MANIYVGCSLTGAPEEFVEMVESIKKMLREAGHEVAEFLGLVKGTEADVYVTDIHKCVAGCDLLVAICDIPSTGLGYELSMQVEKRRMPALAVAHNASRVTRLIIGVDTSGRNPLYRFARYDTPEEIVALVSVHLEHCQQLAS